MYQSWIDEMKESMKPFLNAVEIQTQTAQKLARHQMEFLGECLDLGSRQSEALRDSKDVTAFYRVPMDTYREWSEKVIDSASRQWDTLVEAQGAFNGVVETAQKDVQKEAQKASSRKAA